MAEAVAAFGTAASAMQLADVALRASHEVYEFLSAVKNARKDIQDLKDALRDVDSNVRSLRNYVDAFSKSKNAIEEYEVLPENITRSIIAFRDDLDVLKEILPVSLSPSLAQKVKWVYDRRKVRGVTKRLLDRKLDLVMALSIASQSQELRLREDVACLHSELRSRTNTISRQQEISHAVTTGHDFNLNSLQETQQSNHLKMLQQIHHISEGVKAMQANQLQQEARISHTLNSTRYEIRSDLSQIQPKLNTMDTNLIEMRHAFTFYASDMDVLTKIFRSEVRSALIPVLEHLRTRSEARNEEMSVRMETIVNQISHELGQHATNNKVFRQEVSNELDARNSPLDHSPLDCVSAAQDSHLRDDTEAGSHSSLAITSLYSGSKSHQQLSTSRRTWWYKWGIGSLLIDFYSTRHPSADYLERRTSFVIHVHFWPSQTLLRLPGISMCYESARTQQGYYHIAPMISTFPIISDDHPVWDVIADGDLCALQEMFAQKLVSPRCQDSSGLTLLHSAAGFGMYRICETILSIGGTVDTHNEYGYTPLDLALWSTLVVFTNEADDSYKWKRNREESDIFKTLRLLEERERKTEPLFWEKAIFLHFDHGDRNISTNIYPKLLLEDISVISSKYNMDPWELLFSAWPISLVSPTQTAFDVIQLSLQKGLDPNMRTEVEDVPLLFRAIDHMADRKVGLNSEQDSVQAMDVGSKGESSDATSQLASTFEIKNEGTESVVMKDEEVVTRYICQETDTKGLEVPLWCIVEALVKGGANIYDQAAGSVEIARYWHEILTPTKYIWETRWEVLKEWDFVLRECELNPSEVLIENMQRCKQAIRLRGATRTGFDEESLALPSTSGLRCRVCGWKLCQHGLE